MSGRKVDAIIKNKESIPEDFLTVKEQNDGEQEIRFPERAGMADDRQSD